MRQATLGFLIRENNGEKELLLAMKKKGFGQGKWNGVGGKFDSKRDKDILGAAIREMEEEIGVEIKSPEKMAILNFSYPYLTNSEEREWQTHVFFAKEWEGIAKESEEMKPKWFKINEIPFNQMWPDDKFWLPKVLNGEKLKAKFVFKLPSDSEGERIDSFEIKTT
jgi:8-oxo-dGTP pyrophosphatase MutT (NUDIX family)